jgi:hypothetical protein
MSEALDAIAAELDAGATSPQLLVLLYNAISDAAERGDAAELAQARAVAERLSTELPESLRPDAVRLLQACDEVARQLAPKVTTVCPACGRELEGSPVRCRFCGELLV